MSIRRLGIKTSSLYSHLLVINSVPAIVLQASRQDFGLQRHHVGLPATAYSQRHMNRTSSASYPNINVIMRQLLGVPATLVASERLFSKAGDIITKNSTAWNRLRPTRSFFSYGESVRLIGL